MQGCLVVTICLPSRPLRQTAATAIAYIVGSIGLQIWPGLLQILGQSIEGSDTMKQEGALDTVLKVKFTFVT